MSIFTKKLKEIAEIIMGQSPPGLSYNENGEGLPFYQGVKDFQYRFPVPRVFCTKPTRIAKAGDILFSVRAPIGKVNVANHTCVIGRGLAIIRPHENADSRFIEFVLCSFESNWHAIEGSGSVFGNATKEDLETLEIPWPDVKERRAIAHILGTLDDKIELNRRTCETLEQIARGLFKSWFVDFEPVRAKMSGRWKKGQSLPGLPAYLWDLFPDRLVPSELGDIPDSWEVKRLFEIADVNWGDTNVTKKSYVNIGYKAYSATGPDGFLPYYDYNKTGVVLSAIGENSGATWIAIGKWSCIKNTIRFWSTIPEIPTEYLFLHTYGKHKWFRRGSAQPFISQTDARNTKILIPNIQLAKLFGDLTRPLFLKIEHNEQELHILEILRNSLLPKLIRKEINIKLPENFFL